MVGRTLDPRPHHEQAVEWAHEHGERHSIQLIISVRHSLFKAVGMAENRASSPW
jgi:hypothetical protein